eukprot:gene5335-12930_t
MSAPSLPSDRAWCLGYILEGKHWARNSGSKKVRGRPEDLTLAEGSRVAGRPRPDAALQHSPAALLVICDRHHGAHELELKRLGYLAQHHEGP